MSRRIIDPNSEFVMSLRARHGNAVASEWATGLCMSGWAPFNKAGFNVVDPYRFNRDVTQYLAEKVKPHANR